MSRWTDKLRSAGNRLSYLKRLQKPNSYERGEIAALEWLIPLGEADQERRQLEDMARRTRREAPTRFRDGRSAWVGQ